MIGSSDAMDGYGVRSDRERLRRRRLLLVLLPLTFLLGGLTGGVIGGLLHGSSNQPPASSPAPTSPETETPSASEASTAGPTPRAVESVGGIELVSSPTAPPTKAVTVGGPDFTISGSASHLYPGVTMPIRLTVSNPNDFTITVTSLTVAISANSTPPGCLSSTNIRIVQSNVSSISSIALTAHSSVTLASAPRAPQITLLNLPDVNQDICKGKTFVLTYSGSAH